MGNRVAPEVELAGLDVPEMGVLGYPDFVITPGSDGTAGVPGSAAAAGAQPLLQPLASKS